MCTPSFSILDPPLPMVQHASEWATIFLSTPTHIKSLALWSGSLFQVQLLAGRYAGDIQGSIESSPSLEGIYDLGILTHRVFGRHASLLCSLWMQQQTWPCSALMDYTCSPCKNPGEDHGRQHSGEQARMLHEYSTISGAHLVTSKIQGLHFNSRGNMVPCNFFVLCTWIISIYLHATVRKPSNDCTHVHYMNHVFCFWKIYACTRRLATLSLRMKLSCLTLQYLIFFN